jgi:hypothetical protein
MGFPESRKSPPWTLPPPTLSKGNPPPFAQVSFVEEAYGLFQRKTTFPDRTHGTHPGWVRPGRGLEEGQFLSSCIFHGPAWDWEEVEGRGRTHLQRERLPQGTASAELIEFFLPNPTEPPEW